MFDEYRISVGKMEKVDGGDGCTKERDERVENVCESCSQTACSQTNATLTTLCPWASHLISLTPFLHQNLLPGLNSNEYEGFENLQCLVSGKDANDSQA